MAEVALNQMLNGWDLPEPGFDQEVWINRLTGLEHEAARERAQVPQAVNGDKLPYIPGSITSFIHISLKLAQRMLDERRGDEVVVAYLRLAEVLAPAGHLVRHGGEEAYRWALQR